MKYYCHYMRGSNHLINLMVDDIPGSGSGELELTGFDSPYNGNRRLIWQLSGYLDALQYLPYHDGLLPALMKLSTEYTKEDYKPVEVADMVKLLESLGYVKGTDDTQE